MTIFLHRKRNLALIHLSTPFQFLNTCLDEQLDNDFCTAKSSARHVFLLIGLWGQALTGCVLAAHRLKR